MSGTALPRYRLQRVKQSAPCQPDGQYGALWDVYERGRPDVLLCRCRSYDMARTLACSLALAAYVKAHTPLDELRGMPYLDLIEDYHAKSYTAPEEGIGWDALIPAGRTPNELIERGVPVCAVCAGSGSVYRIDPEDEYASTPAEQCPRCGGTGVSPEPEE